MSLCWSSKIVVTPECQPCRHAELEMLCTARSREALASGLGSSGSTAFNAIKRTAALAAPQQWRSR